MKGPVRVPAAALRERGIRITSYVREVIDYGHVPGTLSGNALRGSAKRYAGRYAKTRTAVLEAVREATGVTDGYVRINGRDARVWIGRDGAPVELTLEN